MANYGLSYPTIATLDVEAGTYKNGFHCGKAVNTDITPNYNEASLFGDNELAEYAKEFKDADVNMGVTTLPIKAANTMFGHTVDEDKKEIIYHAEDTANYVGYGFFANEMVNNVKSYVAVVLPKVKFAEAAENYTTKGDSLEFKTPAISGKAYADNNGNWKYRKVLDTAKEAQAWIDEKLGITATENTEGTENTESTDETETTT